MTSPLPSHYFICHPEIAEGFGSDPIRSKILAHSAGINPGSSINPKAVLTLESRRSEFCKAHGV